jgi:DNA modification methylase
MLAQGWRLRSHIVWDKDRVRPESLAHVKRPLIQWEPILMFSPGTHHRFYPEGLVERGNVWRFPPNATGDKGQAPFPDELARRCILPSTREGEVVLDPFCGSGTTMRVAEELGRRGVGLDLYA